MASGMKWTSALGTCDGSFFFFQAEDGIRDDLVTGVQTCALPIYQFAPSPPGANWSTPGLGTRQTPPLNPQTKDDAKPPSARAFALSPLKVVGGLLVSSTCPNWKSKKVVGLKVW